MKNFPAVVLSLVVPIFAFAATSDFVANGNITVSGVTFGASTTNMVVMDGSTAESWLFNSGAFTVTNPGSAFNISSADSAVKSIQVTSGATTLLCSENTTPGTSYATLPATAGTYTVLPSATTECTSLCSVLSNTATYNAFPTCGAMSCNTGYQLSGSGASAVCAAIPPSGSSQVVGSGPSSPSAEGTPGYIKPRLQTVYADGTVVYLDTPVSAPPSASATFSVNMLPGVSSSDVRRLQTLLASDKDVYPEGTITGYYGTLTKKAVARFQLKYGLVSSVKDAGYGLVGPKTRAKIQEVFGGQASPVVTPKVSVPAIPSSASATFSVNMLPGVSSSDVRRLQTLLASDKDVYPEGTITGYYGTLTKKAVARFQLKYGLVSSVKDAGYGLVGPKTRAKIQEVFGQ